MGLATSGLSWRWSDNGWFGASGVWRTVSATGVFSGDSYAGNGYCSGFNVSGSNIRNRWALGATVPAYSSTWVTYTSTTKSFTGSSSLGGLSDENNNMYDQYLQTSGGLIRYGYKPAYSGPAASYGAWISLT